MAGANTIAAFTRKADGTLTTLAGSRLPRAAPDQDTGYRPRARFKSPIMAAS
jgi:hypothetical protein